MNREGNKPPLSRSQWTLARFLSERSREPMPPVVCAGDDALHVAKLAVNAPLPRAVYVVGADERYLGVIADAQLAREIFTHLDPDLSFDPQHPHSLRAVLRAGEEASRLTARSLMSVGGQTLGERETVADAMRALHRAHRDELPVVDGGGKLVGVVRAPDILREWVEDTLLVQLGDETESFY